MAKVDEHMAQAIQELYECNSDDLIKQQCLAREDYYRRQRTMNKVLRETTEERDGLAAENEKAQETLRIKNQKIAELEEQLRRLQR